MDLEKFAPDLTRDAVFRPCSRESFEFFGEGALLNFCMEKIYQTAWWAVNFCHLSYCSENKISEIINGKAELLEFFRVRTQFAYAVKLEDAIVISFQGSSSREDALLDMQFIPKKADSLAMHRGFYAAFEYLWPDLEKFLKKYNKEKIILAGHSLGGALAYIASNKIDYHSVYTFGAPRVLFGKMPKSVESVYRFVNCSDIVSTVPPAIFGFRHVGDLYFIDEKQIIHEGFESAQLVSKMKSSGEYILQGKSFDRNNAALKSLADHAPINYSRALSRHLLSKGLEN